MRKIMQSLGLPSFHKTPKKIITAAIAVLVSMQAYPVNAKEIIRSFTGNVAKVSDGDTVRVGTPGASTRVRLYGIDAPETEKIDRRTGKISKPGQPFGQEAFRALQSKVAGKTVRIDVVDIDKRYKRLVAVIWLDGRNINREMVAEGYAWAYRNYLDRAHASEYIDPENQARKGKLGLWRQNNPQPPWEFRRFLKKAARDQSEDREEEGN